VSRDGPGDPARQTRLQELGTRLADRLVRRLAARPRAARPRAWFTYHLYHKAPDWLGPRVADALAIPYVVAEASSAPKRAGGPWPARPCCTAGCRPSSIPRPSPLRARRANLRAGLAAQHGWPEKGEALLLAVGMMRPGAKQQSYDVLADALAAIADRDWRLLVAGDGPVRGAVSARLEAAAPGRVTFLGTLGEHALADAYAAADMLVRTRGFVSAMADDDRRLVVTHRGIIRAFYALATGWDLTGETAERLMRAASLARALEAGGFDTTLVSGGTPVPGLDPGAGRFVQLPPTRATDKYFKVLVDADDNRIDDAWKADRRQRLLDVYAETRPDIVMIELYPFGRRQMRFEIEPLLEAARDAAGRRPLIVSSVRDILVEPNKPERIDEMVARVEAYFGLVLVHGDPAFIAFDATFARISEIAGRTAHTGYVIDPPRPRDPDGPGAGEVIVSTGGGAVSDDMLQAAIDARALSALADAPWRVLVGHNLPEAEFAAYRDSAPAGITVERAPPDFPQLIANCRLSISQGGYNTVMEVLAARARAVCIPYAGGHESEQTLRRGLLAARGAIEVVDPAAVTAANVAAAIDRAIARGEDTGAPVDMGGARRTAEILAAALARHDSATSAPKSPDESPEMRVNHDDGSR
jgi:predicted glycosyltransferase